MNASAKNACAKHVWNRRRRGMTLLELMVAIALSAMLLGAMVGVLGGIAKQSKVADTYDQDIWPSRFCSLLRRDLVAAEAVWFSNNVIWIRVDAPAYQNVGVGTRDIGYRCRRTDAGKSVLERLDGERQSVLAIGPTRIAVERLDSLGVPQPLPPIAGPVPAQVRIWVWGDDSDQPAVLRSLVVR